MLYCVPAGPSLTLSPRRKPSRVINVLAASSTDGGGPSSWLDSPAEVDRQKGRGGVGGGGGGRERTEENREVQVVSRNRISFYQKQSFQFYFCIQFKQLNTKCICNNRPLLNTVETWTRDAQHLYSGKQMKHPVAPEFSRSSERRITNTFLNSWTSPFEGFSYINSKNPFSHNKVGFQLNRKTTTFFSRSMAKSPPN